MLRQLARLTRAVPPTGGTLAIAVYAGGNDQPIAAKETGWEGVACVDDVARAVVLLDDLHRRTGIPLLGAWTNGLLRFVMAMQRPDGTFVNFIRDWSGAPNERGDTSRAGGLFWHARALRAMARGAAHGEPGAADGYRRAREAIAPDGVPADVRSIHALDALEAIERGQDRRAELDEWSDQIAAQRRGPLLLDDVGQDAPHLWGHLQEGVLARAGTVLGRPDLIRIAAESAEAMFIPAITARFGTPLVQPYAVACAIAAMDALHGATGDTRYRQLAADARNWFDTRDPSGHAVYDRVRGRVADGVDNGFVSVNSGAESNIVAARALIDEIAADLASQSERVDEIARLLDEQVEITSPRRV